MYSIGAYGLKVPAYYTIMMLVVDSREWFVNLTIHLIFTGIRICSSFCIFNVIRFILEYTRPVDISIVAKNYLLDLFGFLLCQDIHNRFIVLVNDVEQ